MGKSGLPAALPAFRGQHLPVQRSLETPFSGVGDGSALDFKDAAIGESNKGVRRSAPSIVLPYQSADYVNHFAVDIGGSLIKLLYFSPDWKRGAKADGSLPTTGNGRGGRLHFVKFETSRVQDALDFIETKGLHNKVHRDDGTVHNMHVVATGGGAHKFSDEFCNKLGLVLQKEDEMECLVAGCNFLLNAINDEVFTFVNGSASYRHLTEPEVYPYLLVNIGSGVSILKVDGEGKCTRVSGSSLGGGTFWGLCRLLTKVKSFDEMLELSMKGDNKAVDMLVGDIYGGRDYSQIGLSADTIASSFGKVAAQDRDLEDYNPADIAMALCRMVSYNIGHLAYSNAKQYNLRRVIFGGFFIRGHAYTMETISYAIRFWSKGQMEALFMRHEGFLGVMGAFLKVHPITPRFSELERVGSLRGSFKEVYTMGAPFVGGGVHGPAIRGVDEKVSWVEKFVRVGTEAVRASSSSSSSSGSGPALDDCGRRHGTKSACLSDRDFERPMSTPLVGVLHWKPLHQIFPLLADPDEYEPSTIDINQSEEERTFWLNILEEHIPTIVEKAIASEGETELATRRAHAFACAFKAHIAKLRKEPKAYGVKGLGDLFEMRELCLREFGFLDVYKLDKERENDLALQVLPDLLKELDSLSPEQRLLAIVQGVLAANIFDWGSRECIEKYKEGTILSIYQDARERLSMRPWRVDNYDALQEKWFKYGRDRPPYRRVMIFVDNAGADMVLGMLPFARELLRRGSDVVLVGNTSPAINDITADEIAAVVERAAQQCGIVAGGLAAARAAQQANGGRVPPHQEALAGDGGLKGRVAGAGDVDVMARSGEQASASPAGVTESTAKLFVVESGSGSPCLDLRCVSGCLTAATPGTDLVVVEGMGRAVHTNYKARFKCDALKLAMIKTSRVAENLFGGNLYDCICVHEEGTEAS
ncbi:unnamed protein product [Ostreobium quekettii]|uniref:pantothenate kinase n=1 Tax=Ostreobium quekettii TaxID=121088 RepID=A0A8S1J0D5_9CHLO|nr:unnamed protein product [Ostreobium quekettii]|eukprot:evm.model.scf_422.10 EVM.evm.TU.scf_422.10   scf_422:71250-79981(-)